MAFSVDLEGFLDTGFDGAPRGFGVLLRRVVHALDAMGVDFAVVGAVAMSARGRTRNTEDVDILIPSRHRTRVMRLIGDDLGFEPNPEDPGAEPFLARMVDPKSGLGLDLMFFTEGFEPEASAVETADRIKLFGLNVPVAQPEFLAWMLLLSDQPRHEDDLLGMLRRRLFDANVLDELLAGEGDDEARARLRSLRTAAKKKPSGWRPKGPKK